MQIMIGNRCYDTQTAKALGHWQRGYTTDKGHLNETLYVTENGDYFLYGAGGPRSRYAQRVAPNTWGYGERILPMSVDEAHAWAENHLTESEQDRQLSADGDHEGQTSITLQLRSVTIARLQQEAAKQGVQPSELADRLLSGNLG